MTNIPIMEDDDHMYTHNTQHTDRHTHTHRDRHTHLLNGHLRLVDAGTKGVQVQPCYTC